MGNSGDFHLPQGGDDVGSDLLLVDPLRRGSFARHIFGNETLGEIRDGGGRAGVLSLARGISAAIDLAFEPPGFLTGLRRVPGAEGPDRIAALLSVTLASIGEREGLRPGRCDADAEAFYGIIEDEAVMVPGL